MTAVIDPFTAECVGDSAESIRLDQSQRDAVKLVPEWLERRIADPKVKQVFRVGGHAGSGKTTIVKEILARFPDLNIAVTTFTGKASEVLRGKGVPSAINLHRIFYTVDQAKMTEKMALESQLAAAEPGDVQSMRERIQRLSIDMQIPADEIPYDLVIVDEASMVPGRIAEDLKRYGKPILAVGDPMQLPPIKDERTRLIPALFAGQKIDAMLTGQHRTGNELLARACEAARANEGLPAAVVVDAADVNYADYDAVLVFTNKARWDVIHRVRGEQGKPKDEPIVGDEITVLCNDPGLQLFNGSTLRVAHIELGPKTDTYRIFTPEGGEYLIDRRGFTGDKGEKKAKESRRKGVAVATFCEAMTVHKAQGSEWNRVLIAQDHSGWHSTPEEQVRWRYTAVSRAKSTLHAVGDSFLKPVK